MAKAIRSANKPAMPYRIAIHYDPGSSIPFTVAIGPRNSLEYFKRRVQCLSAVIAALKSLGITQDLLSDIVRRFGAERQIIIDDIPILNADLWRTLETAGSKSRFSAIIVVGSVLRRIRTVSLLETRN
jgi:hypothetical protein